MTLPTVSSRCRRGWACVLFQLSLGLCDTATHAWQDICQIPDQAGHGGLRRARMIEVGAWKKNCQEKAWKIMMMMK